MLANLPPARRDLTRSSYESQKVLWRYPGMGGVKASGRGNKFFKGKQVKQGMEEAQAHAARQIEDSHVFSVTATFDPGTMVLRK